MFIEDERQLQFGSGTGSFKLEAPLILGFPTYTFNDDSAAPSTTTVIRCITFAAAIATLITIS